jgi:hypothetical protein
VVLAAREECAMKRSQLDKVIERLEREIGERQKMIALLVAEQAAGKTRKRTKPRAVPKVEQSA